MYRPDLTVVTAVYGDDELVDPPAQTWNARWVCVSDRPRDSDVWEVIVEPRPYMEPRLAAKVVKWRPDLYARSELTLWLDGSVRLRAENAIDQLMGSIRGYRVGVGMIQHPDRTCIRDEAVEAMRQAHHQGQMIHEQVAHYLQESRFVDDKLWATTVIARRTSPLIRMFGDRMLLQMMRWSYNEQVAVPYVAWHVSIPIQPIPEHLWTTELFSLWQRPTQ